MQMFVHCIHTEVFVGEECHQIYEIGNSGLIKCQILPNFSLPALSAQMNSNSIFLNCWKKLKSRTVTSRSECWGVGSHWNMDDWKSVEVLERHVRLEKLMRAHRLTGGAVLRMMNKYFKILILLFVASVF